MSVWLVVVRRASELCFCYVLELGLLHVGAAAAAVAGLGARKRLVGWLAGWMDHDLMKGGGGGDAGTSLFAFFSAGATRKLHDILPCIVLVVSGSGEVGYHHDRVEEANHGTGGGSASLSQDESHSLVRYIALHSAAWKVWRNLGVWILYTYLSHEGRRR